MIQVCDATWTDDDNDYAPDVPAVKWLLMDEDFLAEPADCVLKLLECDDVDEADEWMSRIQQRLRTSDDDLMVEIRRALSDSRYSAEGRSLLLEATVGARVARYANAVTEEILRALNSPHEDLRFAAVAAASDLCADRRAQVIPFVNEHRWAIEPAAEVRRAAGAFIKANAELSTSTSSTTIWPVPASSCSNTTAALIAS